MRKLLALALFAAPLSLSAQAARTTWVVVTEDSTISIALNTERLVKDRDGMLDAWFRTKLTTALTTADGKPYRDFDDNIAIDCRALRMKAIRTIIRDDLGGILNDEIREKPPWLSQIPGSRGEAMATEACKHAPKK